MAREVVIMAHQPDRQRPNERRAKRARHEIDLIMKDGKMHTTTL
jgi:hypothetical protein